MLWLKAHTNDPKEKPNPPSKPDKPKPKEEDKGPKKTGFTFVPVDPGKGFKPEISDNLPGGQKSPNAQPGNIYVIPDTEKVVPLSPADTWATLAEHARRIAEARRQQRNPKGPAQLSTKDW